MTSKKSLSSRSSRNAVEIFDSKSFHRRQNFSEAIFRPKVGLKSSELDLYFFLHLKSSKDL